MARLEWRRRVLRDARNDMPIIADATRYLAETLSDNIARTPEGYLICCNAIIGRTGFQDYLAGEIQDPKGLLAGIPPDQIVKLWRDPKEVFATPTIASFEGKTFTLEHPAEQLDATNTRDHDCGHVQNVRAGSEALDDGNLPLLADIIVTDAEAIRAIESGERELSCGYSFDLCKTGNRFDQTGIIGNHVALVAHGRAGAEARINDSATTIRKERTVKNTKDTLKYILGLGLQAFAKDADPEEVTKAAEALHPAHDAEEEHEEEREKKEDRAPVRDEPEAKTEPEPEKSSTHDAHRKRLHDALDRMMDESQSEREEEKDADLDELRKLLNEYFHEEEDEPEHEGDEAVDPVKDVEMFTDPQGYVHPIRGTRGYSKRKTTDEEPDEPAAKKSEEGEDAEIVNPEPVLAENERPQSQLDSAMDVLRAIRPAVARSRDKRIMLAFDQQLQKIRAARAPANSKSSYKEFSQAARTHVADSKQDEAPESDYQKRCRELDELYKKEMLERASRAIKRG